MPRSRADGAGDGSAPGGRRGAGTVHEIPPREGDAGNVTLPPGSRATSRTRDHPLTPLWGGESTQRVPGARERGPSEGPEGVTFPAVFRQRTGPSGSAYRMKNRSRKPRLRCGLPSHLPDPTSCRPCAGPCASRRDRAVLRPQPRVPAPQPCRPCASFPRSPLVPGVSWRSAACPGRHETPGTHLGRPPRRGSQRDAPRTADDGREPRRATSDGRGGREPRAPAARRASSDGPRTREPRGAPYGVAARFVSGT